MKKFIPRSTMHSKLSKMKKSCGKTIKNGPKLKKNQISSILDGWSTWECSYLNLSYFFWSLDILENFESVSAVVWIKNLSNFPYTVSDAVNFLFQALRTRPQGCQECQKIKIFMQYQILAVWSTNIQSNLKKREKRKKWPKKPLFLTIVWKFTQFVSTNTTISNG